MKNPKLRQRILEDMESFLRQYYKKVEQIDSPIKGRSGNLEALLYAKEKR
ncbi:hypothetical protein [uncultured Dubosiella sp.]|nr:hypothetical protein [uncultured Dubosiella sp.]